MCIRDSAYMFPYTKALGEKWGERGILCWDLFRMSNLVQCCLLYTSQGGSAQCQGRCQGKCQSEDAFHHGFLLFVSPRRAGK